MAKFGKLKPNDVKCQRIAEADCTSCAVVRHEKLCLRVDVHNNRLHGFAELKVVSPKKAVMGLHARGLNIERVLYDGVQVQYKIVDTFKQESFDNDFCAEVVPVSASDVADSGHAKYMGALEKESAPELLIFVPRPPVGFGEESEDKQIDTCAAVETNGDVANLETPKEEVAAECGEQLRLLRVDYTLEKPESGAYFVGNMFHTTNQPRRARCWFPCVDMDFYMCSYEMEFTVDSEFVAVSCGKPIYQVLGKEGRNLKTYVYKLDVPIAARLVSLIVAPLEVYPDRQNFLISHFCIPGHLSQLQCTITFFHSIFSYFEDYLGTGFPFGSYNHVFVDSDFTISSASIGAAVSLFNSHLLVDEKIIDQTINTRIKMVHSLAQQWFGVFILPETRNDAWLVEGLSMFLTDLFVKRHFGNNESHYRRFKANEAVCKADIDGSPPLSHHIDLHGTERLGVLGRIWSWKAGAVVQMLEKQMGPDAFRKILQRIVIRSQDPARKLRTLSMKEFRHFANKLGNLERLFLKEFFHRWVELPGCPVLRMGFVYSKRRNMIELAVHRSSTATLDKTITKASNIPSGRRIVTDMGWPGMMSIRIHELDGMYDHPNLPMTGEVYQLLEIQCHSKLVGRRIPRPRKGNKADGLEEVDSTLGLADARQNIESPLLWIRADPQMEYLSDIQLQQPEQMWINQLEKDRDVVAQLQAISALCMLPQVSFMAVNALNNCLIDSKVFYRVRIEAALALASTATEATGWAGLSHLIQLYKGRRYDPETGLPRPNNFHDFAEYFVLEVIPGAVAAVRSNDGKSPPEAVEFICQLLKHNDNSGNPFSDVFWLASVVKSIGKLEYGQQSLGSLHWMLKYIDRLLQYDRIMPSYNNLITISCIHTLMELGLKFCDLLPVAQIEKILLPFKNTRSMQWRVRAEAVKANVELEMHLKGIDAGVRLAFWLINTEPSIRVQSKLFAHTLHLSILKEKSKDSIQGVTLSRLLLLLQSKLSFHSITVRHHTFSLLQVFAGRPATLFRCKTVDAKASSTEERAASLDKIVAPVKPSLFKVRLQPPPGVLVQSVEHVAGERMIEPVHVEQTVEPFQLEQTSEPACLEPPVRLRILTSASQQLRESVSTANAISSTKQEPDRKVGVVKLKLKSSTARNMNVNSEEKGRADQPVQSSSLSLDFGVRDVHPSDSPHSIKHDVADAALIKGEDDDVREPSSSNDIRISKNGLPQKPKVNYRLEKPDADVIMVPADAGVTFLAPDLETDIVESHGERQSGQEEIVQQLMVKQEEEEFSQVGLRTMDESVRKHKRKKKKKKKRHRERDDDQSEHHDRGHDKHNDPDYVEQKHLRKENRREEERQHLNNHDGGDGTPLTLAKANTDFSSEKPAVVTKGPSETVIRLKIKRKVQVDD